ncbi:MAG: DUF503 domain-containing protein [Planctomycetes bacterium]|nr:DUF503 domain-containing protein [Planctomycetota bacterium]
MTVGILRVRGLARHARSLKDKRRVVKSVKDQLAAKFNISIAEVDHLDSLQQIALGISLVGTDRQFVDSSLCQVVHHLRLSTVFELVDFDLEFV